MILRGTLEYKLFISSCYERGLLWLAGDRGLDYVQWRSEGGAEGAKCPRRHLP